MIKNGIIGDVGQPDEHELEEINRFTRRTFKAEELYSFKVALCDNNVDRDFERFTDETLDKLAEMFVGKTGIFDHSHKSENQCARIYSASVEAVDGKTNLLGKPYLRLLAKAYMPKSERSESLILDIESGIKKEVSIGCSVKRSSCSVCGMPAGSCKHRKGRYYSADGMQKLCFFDLIDPQDAYEWSFVAVPAQPEAGVVKSLAGGEFISMGPVEKRLDNGRLILSESEAKTLAEYVNGLSDTAEKAGEFLKHKKGDILSVCLADPGSPAAAVLSKALDSMEPAELFMLYCGTTKPDGTAELQLAARKFSQKTKKNNGKFMI